MKTETISLTRALVELKMIDKKLQAKTLKLLPVAIMKGGRLPEEIKSKAEFDNKVKADYQSIRDLTKRRRNIKSALVNANATTRVKIADEEMTIAEAIERKASIDYEKNLLRNLAQKYSQSLDKIEEDNRAMKGQLLKLLEATYSKSETELGKDDYNKVATPFKENNESSLLDPLGIKAEMDKLEQTIHDFETEVDVVISEANARTEITI